MDYTTNGYIRYMLPTLIHFYDWETQEELQVQVTPIIWQSDWGTWRIAGVSDQGTAGQGYWKYMLYPPSLIGRSYIPQTIDITLYVQSIDRKTYYWSSMQNEPYVDIYYEEDILEHEGNPLFYYESTFSEMGMPSHLYSNKVTFQIETNNQRQYITVLGVPPQFAKQESHVRLFQGTIPIFTS